MLKRSTPFYPTPLPGRIPGYRRERVRPKLLAEAKLFARARPGQVTRRTKNDLALLLTLNHACPGDVFHNASPGARSEEHTSELQSHSDLVCRLLLEKKKKKHKY